MRIVMGIKYKVTAGQQRKERAVRKVNLSYQIVE
jgi:hypothetical protein